MRSCAGLLHLIQSRRLLPQLARPSSGPLCPLLQVNAHLGSARQGPAEHQRSTRDNDQYLSLGLCCFSEHFSSGPPRSRARLDTESRADKTRPHPGYRKRGTFGQKSYIVRLLLTGVVLALAFAGCGGGSSASRQPLYTYPESAKAEFMAGCVPGAARHMTTDEAQTTCRCALLRLEDRLPVSDVELVGKADAPANVDAAVEDALSNCVK